MVDVSLDAIESKGRVYFTIRRNGQVLQFWNAGIKTGRRELSERIGGEALQCAVAFCASNNYQITSYVEIIHRLVEDIDAEREFDNFLVADSEFARQCAARALALRRKGYWNVGPDKSGKKRKQLLRAYPDWCIIQCESATRRRGPEVIPVIETWYREY